MALLVEREDIGTDGMDIGTAWTARTAGQYRRSRVTCGALIPETVTLQVAFRVMKCGGMPHTHRNEVLDLPRRGGLPWSRARSGLRPRRRSSEPLRNAPIRLLARAEILPRP